MKNTFKTIISMLAISSLLVSMTACSVKESDVSELPETTTPVAISSEITKEEIREESTEKAENLPEKTEEITLPEKIETKPEEVVETEKTTEPAETTPAPVVTTAPKETTVPKTTFAPVVTTAPKETTVPKTTFAPAVTTAPKETTVPKTTFAPVVTTAPKETTVPKTTFAPVVTTAPKETTVPKTTFAPAVTTAPKETTVPKVTPAPVVTTTPKETTVPKVTPAPVVTTTPPVTTTPVVTTTPAPVVTTEPVKKPSGRKTIRTQEDLYDALLEASLKGQKTLDIYLDASEDIDLLGDTTMSYVVDCGRLRWSGDGTGNIKYTITYTPGRNIIIANKSGNTSSLSSSEKELYEKAKRIVADCTSSSASDYDNAKALHDYLVNNTVYAYTGGDSRYDARGPILYGESVCAGYTDAYNLLLGLAGIESYQVTGESVNSVGSRGNHAWNLVNLDGRWVYVDVTWDDPVTSDGSNKLRYDYFAISESEISTNHFWTKDYTDKIKSLA